MADPNTVSPVAKTPAPPRIDPVKVFDLALKGVNGNEIAKILGCSHQGIYAVINKFKCLMLSAQEVETLDQHMGRMVKSAMAEMLRIAVDPDKIKKLSARDALWNFAVLFDKNRILEGKSTANVFHGVMVSLQREALDSAIKTAKSPGNSGKIARNEDIVVAEGDTEPAEVPADAKLVSASEDGGTFGGNTEE